MPSPTRASSRKRPDGEPIRHSWVTQAGRSAGDYHRDAGTVPVQLEGEALARPHWRPSSPPPGPT